LFLQDGVPGVRHLLLILTNVFREVFLPAIRVPKLNVVPDPNKCDGVLKSSSFSQFLIQEQSSLPIQFDLTGQSKCEPFKCHRFVWGIRPWRHGKGDLLETFFGIKAQNAVRSENKVKIAAVLVCVDLASELVGNEQPTLIINGVLVLAC
jgi:hypothetical protein